MDVDMDCPMAESDGNEVANPLLKVIYDEYNYLINRKCGISDMLQNSLKEFVNTTYLMNFFKEF